MTESNQEIEFSEQDVADLARLGVAPPEEGPYHSILEIWLKVLTDGITADRHSRISPTWANRIVQSYPEVKFADVPHVAELYFGNLEGLKAIVEAEVKDDDEALKVDSADADREENHHHYLTILINWQLQLLEWELEWDTTQPDAGAYLAAWSEAYKIFFGAPNQTGISAYLENIRFEMGDAEGQILSDALEELRATYTEEG